MRDERRQQLRVELRARLSRVRGDMTEDEFDKLIAAVERTAARFAEIDAGPGRHRRDLDYPPTDERRP